MLVSALMLVVFLAALDLWLNRHFNIGLDRPGALVPVVGAISGGWGLVSRLLGKADLNDMSNAARRTLRRFFFSPTSIVVLWVAFALAALLWSSVTVVAEAGAKDISVTLTRLDALPPTNTSASGAVKPDSVAAVDNVRSKQGKGLVRFGGVTTSPLAGPYVVKAHGYQPAVVEASPLLGARVVLGTDVRRAPGLLIRPDETLLEQLRAHGRLEVYRRQGGELDSLVFVVAPTAGSFLIGRNHVPVSALIAEWERELFAAGVTDSQLRNRHLVDWKRVQSPDFTGQLAAGDTIVVQVVAPSGRVSGNDEVVLGGEDIADLFLRRTPGG